jgi:outer membrane protein assembly factor BamB
MRRERKRYDAALKAKVALEALKGQRTTNEIASVYGVHPNQVAQWKKQVLEQLPEIFSGGRARREQQDEELRDQLYQQIGQLKVELDWLKKKLDCSAKEVVAAYSLDYGREQWIHGWDAFFQESMGGDGPRATPTWHEGRLYALGAAGEFRCLDARSGKRIWSHNILSDNQAENLTWGMAASPLVVDDKVIVLPGGTGGKSVVAYDRLTGIPVWKVLDDRQAYTSPQLVTLAGRRQVLVVSARRAMGLTVEEGTLLWEYPWTTEYDINSAQPIVIGENRFFISAGYDHGAALVEIIPKGDLYEARTVWQNNRMKNKFSSSVLHEGYIYGFDESILACIDAATGLLKWKGGRYGFGQLLLASGHLVITSETGDVVLVKATPEMHEEIARFPAISGKTWNVPALAHGRLIVRNSTEMACFRIGDDSRSGN